MDTVLLVMLGAALTNPAPAIAELTEQPTSNQTQLYSKLYERYEDLGYKPGRHVVKDGIEAKYGDRPVTSTELQKFNQKLKELIIRAREAQKVQAQVASSAGSATGTGGVAAGELASIRNCESGGNYSTNTGNGYYGAYQFDQQTWQAAGGTGTAHTASPAEQDRVAANWIAKGNRGSWPSC